MGARLSRLFDAIAQGIRTEALVKRSPQFLYRDLLAAGGLGLALRALLRLVHREKPGSYPGNALPDHQQLKRRAVFTPGPRPAIERGWYPAIEEQAAEVPHPISRQMVWKFDPTIVRESDTHGLKPFDPSVNSNSADQVFRLAMAWPEASSAKRGSEKPPTPYAALRKGFDYFQKLQSQDGHWASDYGGPHFLLPGFVIASYIAGRRQLDRVLPAPYWRAALLYVRNHQQADGGWGTHLEAPSTLFCTVQNYVALRLLGTPVDDPMCQRCREFMHSRGGALYAAPWAKFWLAFLGVYDLRGLAPVTPELWLLPSWFPLHPGKFWCHCRMVYIPMCYLYGLRYQYDAASDPVTRSLREELYTPGTKYSEIKWHRYMFSCDAADEYTPIPWVLKVVMKLFSVYEWTLGPFTSLRNRALKYVADYIQAEDVTTNYLTIGPVSKAFHVLVAFIRGGGRSDPDGARRTQEFKAHAARMMSYIWIAEDGLKVQGYNGSMCWDTSFALQACAEAKLEDEYPEMCAKAWGWLTREQVRMLPHGDWQFWRQPIRGGWGFSTAEQAWPVSDTTGEAFKAVLALRGKPCVAAGESNFPEQHYFDSVEYIISYQNSDGGWATYENTRGSPLFELLNPSCVFGSIMIDYSYVECTSSVMQALSDFSEHWPQHRREEIQRVLRRGASFLEAMQRTDGSWYGCWGVCFTYGCWFGIEGLIAAGKDPTTCQEIQRSIKFLLSKQNSDGGWGEDFSSCFNREYQPIVGPDGKAQSTIVNTAWALLALMCERRKDVPHAQAIERGIRFLVAGQQESGDFPQERIVGVFNRSVAITYTCFRNVFPLWALGRYARTFECS